MKDDIVSQLPILTNRPIPGKRVAAARLKQCPHCGEKVQPGARVWRFCRHELWTAA